MRLELDRIRSILYQANIMNTASRQLVSTVLGGVGLFIWSLTAWMAVQLSNIPPFQFLLITQGITFLFACARLTIKRCWHATKQPVLFWVIGMTCIPLNLMGYFCAFRYIDAALADLIYYMYPIHVLIIGSVVMPGRTSFQPFLGSILGFLGVAILLYHDIPLFTASWKWQGLLFALIGSLSWAVYTLTTKSYWKAPYEMIGLFFGMGAAIALIGHLASESYVPPTVKEWFIMAVWGLVVQSLAISFWEVGIRHGNFGLLNTMSYSVPVLSVCLLVLSGYTSFTIPLLAATLLVTTGVYLSSRTPAKKNSYDLVN